MGDKTAIAWTDSTWSPTRACQVISPGCANCYAMRQAGRMSGKGGAYEGLVKLTGSGFRWTGAGRLVPKMLDQPLRWTKPRRIFVDSMSDLFYEGFSDVRDNPVSVGRPWLRAAALGEALERDGIGYRHEKALGNPFRRERDGLDVFRAFLLGHGTNAYEAREAMRQVRYLGSFDSRVALLCGCKVEAKCHRSVLLAFAKARGMDVETET